MLQWAQRLVETAPLLAGCLGFQALDFVFQDLYVGMWRQRRVVKTASVPPALAATMTPSALEQARSYALDKLDFSFW